MRNIAILEWGPASLFYVQPREKIKVRTGWLGGGPQMPAFLSTKAEAKLVLQIEGVRYALSAYEDLNHVIRNLRRCFGFPYQECIGYLNTMTHKHRARREHESLVDRLRQWAIFGNVDAVVWIDYEKSNQRPGSFKAGRKASVPYSPDHIEICSHILGGHGTLRDDDGDESEGGWSAAADNDEAEHPQGEDLACRQPRVGSAGNTNLAATSPGEVERYQPIGRSLQLPGPNASAQCSLKRSGNESAAAKRSGLKLSRGDTSAQNTPRTVTSSEAARRPRPQSGATPRGDRILDASAGMDQSAEEKLNATRTSMKAGLSVMDQMMIQEEDIPAFGSIYPRSMVPGPGYYGIPMPPGRGLSAEGGSSFGRRPKGRIDEVVRAVAGLPGPGEYEMKAGLAELRAASGTIGNAAKLVSPMETQRKMPYISAFASDKELYGINSPALFHDVTDAAVELARARTVAPKFSFSKAKRPW